MKNARQFDLNLLVALDALLTERNVTRAGERLHLSQSAMSGILSRLRHIFDDRLLVRVGRDLEPTDLAADLAGPVHECVQKIEDLLTARRPFAPEIESRSFTILASDYVAMIVLGPLVKNLTELAPSVSVRFVAPEMAVVGDRLAAAQIDFAVLPEGIAPGFPSMPLFEDDWTCAVWCEHPSVGDRLTIDEFRTLPHLAFNPDLEHTSLVEEYFAQTGHDSRTVASVQSFATAAFSVHGTPLITIIPRRLGKLLQKPAELKLVELPFEAPALRERLVWNPRFTDSPAHAWFRALLTEVAKLP